MNKQPNLRKRIGLEIFRKMRHNAARMHQLQTLFWECTSRCNLACKHCGSDCKVSAAQADMPVADFLRVIDNITPHVNPNKTFIIFTGGEALVRNDMERCGAGLNHRGFPWGLVSNGMLLDKKRLHSLLAAGMHTITISLDGFEEAHNWLRGHPKSFERAVNAIKLIAGEKRIVAWDVVTCVNAKNLADLPVFRDFLIETGVKDWRIFTVFPVGRAAEYPEFQLNDENFTAVLEFIKQTRREGKIHVSYGCEGFLGNYEMEVRDHFYTCQAGINVASVLANGAISACPSIRADYNQGNIYQDDFWEVWQNRFRSFRDRSWAKTGICADCAVWRYCEGNGMHLHQGDGKLLLCHWNRII
ncbi:MAG: TIGR04133 family radical SAM/SPASM protein [Bacteroidales bacterium]|jgi:radical SAM enzyme (rSAM/lipoprotein system)|nr:TIGR04133 family radical SAM/SPASM protein [Bacteroidales bacterium]